MKIVNLFIVASFCISACTLSDLNSIEPNLEDSEVADELWSLDFEEYSEYFNFAIKNQDYYFTSMKPDSTFWLNKINLIDQTTKKFQIDQIFRNANITLNEQYVILNSSNFIGVINQETSMKQRSSYFKLNMDRLTIYDKYLYYHQRDGVIKQMNLETKTVDIFLDLNIHFDDEHVEILDINIDKLSKSHELYIAVSGKLDEFSDHDHHVIKVNQRKEILWISSFEHNIRGYSSGKIQFNNENVILFDDNNSIYGVDKLAGSIETIYESDLKIYNIRTFEEKLFCRIQDCNMIVLEGNTRLLKTDFNCSALYSVRLIGDHLLQADLGGMEYLNLKDQGYFKSDIFSFNHHGSIKYSSKLGAYIGMKFVDGKFLLTCQQFKI